MSTDSTRLLPIVSSIWLIRHIVEFRETKMPWAVQKPAEERKSWLRDCEWQVCEVLYESWKGTTWIRHRCAIQRTCANRSGNTKPATEMEKTKTQSECHVLSFRHNRGMDTGCQDTEYSHWRRHRQQDTGMLGRNLEPRDQDLSL